MTTSPAHVTLSPPSAWVMKWTHLFAPGCHVLDIACGHGRHMKWFHDHQFNVTGIDRDPDAIKKASVWGTVVSADIENNPWPLTEDGVQGTALRQFDAVVVTNYLWRSLKDQILLSVSDGGILIYETFAQGNEAFGKPSRPEFLLEPGELLTWCNPGSGFSVVAYETGLLSKPARCVQRLVAIKSQQVVKMQQLESVI